MVEYEEVLESIEIPKNVGIKGFLRAVEDILKLPRVQDINIDARGRVDYRYYLREGEEKKPLGTDFSSLTPYGVMRNGKVTELADPSKNAAVALGQLFDAAAVDHVFATVMVGGAKSQFWDWYKASTGVALLSREELCSVPFLTDRMVEDNVLILCAAYSRGGALVDTQRSYKLVIPTLAPLSPPTPKDVP
jgi:hypothetical protein